MLAKPAILVCCGRLHLLSFIAAFFSPRSLGRSSPNFAICYKIQSEIWRPDHSQKNFGRPKTKISARFQATFRLDREYPRNATRYCQQENGVCKLRSLPRTRTKFGELWSTNSEKNRNWTELKLTQRAAIRLTLGIATMHSSLSNTYEYMYVP